MRPMLIACALALADCAAAQPREIAYSFPSPAQGARLVGARDGFFEGMNAADIALRASGGVRDREALRAQFVAGVEEWTASEQSRLSGSLARIAPRLRRFARLMPSVIPVVKVSNEVEDGLPHTRGDAIVLPGAVLAAVDDATLDYAMAHELFHVLSRRQVRHRDAIYAVIGFRPCRFELPASLASRRIMNPDAFREEHYVPLSAMSGAPLAVPLLLLRDDVDAAAPRLNESIMARLLIVEVRDGECLAATGPDGGPVLMRAADVPAVFDVIGRNSTYVSHPEELSADNFATLIVRPDQAQSPEVPERLALVLEGF